MRRNKIARIELPVASVLRNPEKDWGRLSQGRVRIAGDRKLAVDWDEFNQDNYLFTHATIVGSVKVGDNGYYIEHPCDELVNSNGNAWTNQVLLATFKSFIGKPNYLEHFQHKEASKGKILDAVIRPVEYKGSDGSKADVFYVDILVATDKRHRDLVASIEDGVTNCLSMGCVVNEVTCSKCGKIFGENERTCDHIANELLTYFTGDDGKQHIISELCGSMRKGANGEWEANPNSMEFIEASWVAQPAFKGAVVNHFIGQVDKKAANVLQFPHTREELNNIFALRVADKESAIVLKIVKDTILKAKDRALVERVAKDYIR